ncbi:hypothetical protein VIGAN_04376300, partial [Vigna angularis var. angularis]
ANKAGKILLFASSPVAPMTEMQSEGFPLTSMGVADKPVCSKEGYSMEVTTPSGAWRIEDESETGPFSFDKPEFSKLFSMRILFLGCFGD